MNRFRLVMFAGIAAAATTAHAQVDYLMVLNSSSTGVGRRVMLFSHVDGTLINDSFIHESGTPGGWGGIMKGIQQVGDDIWISTQNQARLHRYDAAGNYLETIGDGHLANVRGFAHYDGVFYITIGSPAGSIPTASIVKLDISGNYLGSFVVGGSPFDAFITGPNELMVSHSSGTDKLTRWTFDGNFIDVFHAGSISWPQQINQRANGNFLVAGWSGAAGIYEYDGSGNQVNFISASSARGAYELENGNILWTGAGVFIHDVASGTNIQVADGTGQYIAAYGTQAPPCYADCDANETLNIDDFLCFINEFSQAQMLPVSQQITHYANCDGSTNIPVLTIDDFLCFINEFSQGCP